MQLRITFYFYNISTKNLEISFTISDKYELFYVHKSSLDIYFLLSSGVNYFKKQSTSPRNEMEMFLH